MSSAYFRGPRTIFPAPDHPGPVYLPPEAACPELEPDLSLAGRFIEARERRGITLKQAALEGKLPASYVEMMETGNYGAIPDLLYLLPFFRRYAEFLGLDVAEVTASFMRDFEAEENAVLIPGSPRALARKPLSWRRIARSGAVIGATASIAALAVMVARRSPSQSIAAVQAAMSSPAAPVALTPTIPLASVAPAALARLAPLAPLAPLAVATMVPITAISPAHTARVRPTASITTARATQGSHRRPAATARHRHPIRRHHITR